MQQNFGKTAIFVLTSRFAAQTRTRRVLGYFAGRPYIDRPQEDKRPDFADFGRQKNKTNQSPDGRALATTP